MSGTARARAERRAGERLAGPGEQVLGRAGRVGGKRGTGDAGVGRRWSWPAKEKEERAEVEVYGPNGEGDRGLGSGWTGFGSSFSISSFLSSFSFPNFTLPI